MAHPLTQISNFNYDTLSKEIDLDLVTNAKDTKNKTKEGLLLDAYLDDFWQAGAGSLMPPASGSNASIITGLFEKRFVFRNVIKECVERVAGAFFGKAPNWRYQVDGKEVDEATKLDDIDKALSEFWTKQNVAEALSKAFESRLVFRRGGVRIYIPTKFKNKNKVLKTGIGATPDVGSQEQSVADAESEDYVRFPNIVEAIQAMRVEFVPPTQGKLLDDGGEYFSIVKYEVREDWETKKNVNVIEFSFVDDSGATWVGTIKENDTKSSIEDANLSSGFELAEFPTYNEFKGIPFVTQALYKNNQLLNLALTCAGFSLVDNGFGEMILTNVELETYKVEGPDGTTIDVPKRIARGGGASQNFVGLEVVDETTGAVSRTTPGVTFRDPTPMNAFKDGAAMAYEACLQEAGQMYALISGDATASGESRIQALSDFLLKITKYKSEVDEQGSWLLTVVLLWAAALSEDKTVEKTRVVFDSRVHVASLSDAEKATVMNMRKDGAISRETERVLLGVDDPSLEEDRILAEQGLPPEETTVEEFSEKLDVGLKMLSLNIDVDTIQKYLGYTDAQIAEMKQRAADEQAALQAQIDAQMNPPDAGVNPINGGTGFGG